MLVKHRIDDVDEGLVAVEETVAPREKITFEPALALMLAEHFDHAARGSQMIVGFDDLSLPLLIGRVEDGGESIGSRLVGSEDTEVLLVVVLLDHIAEKFAKGPGVLRRNRSWRRDVDRVVGKARAAANRGAEFRRWRGDWPPSCRSPFGSKLLRIRRGSRPFWSNSSCGL